MKFFRSKIDWWMALIILFIVVFPPVKFLCFGTLEAYISLGFAWFISVILLFCFIPIRYILKNDFLEIKCGFCVCGKIPYNKIESICYCKMPLIERAPVMSRDCIKINLKDINGVDTLILSNSLFYEPKKWTYISPKRKEEFMELLRIKLSKIA